MPKLAIEAPQKVRQLAPVRVTDSDFNMVREAARLRQMTHSEYVRHAVVTTARRDLLAVRETLETVALAGTGA